MIKFLKINFKKFLFKVYIYLQNIKTLVVLEPTEEGKKEKPKYLGRSRFI